MCVSVCVGVYLCVCVCVCVGVYLCVCVCVCVCDGGGSLLLVNSSPVGAVSEQLLFM